MSARHARHLRTSSVVFSLCTRLPSACRRCSSPNQGQAPRRPGNRCSQTHRFKTCDKKEKQKQMYIQCSRRLHRQHGPKDHAGHVCAERNGSSSCCKQYHAFRGNLMPYLDYWPSFHESVGGLNSDTATTKVAASSTSLIYL